MIPDYLLPIISQRNFELLEKTPWETINRERGLLIDKDIAGTITRDEKGILEALQAYADYHIDKVAPKPSVEEILRAGKERLEARRRDAQH